MVSIQGMVSLIPTLGAAFLPTNIAGLQLWLDANDASTLFQDAAKTTLAGNGDVVGAWADKSGQGNDATQATTSNKPKVSAAAIGGLNAVLGDATDDVMGISVGPLTNETIFAVVKRTITNVSGVVIAAGNPYKLVFGTAGNVVRFSYNGLFNEVNSGFVELNGNIYRHIYDGTANKLSVNNGAEAILVVASGGHTFTTIFSQTAGGGLTLQGSIGELLVYNSGLSIANVALVENYLSNKWSITIA